MVVKQANITSYKVSDPGEILDRRPVVQASSILISQSILVRARFLHERISGRQDLDKNWT